MDFADLFLTNRYEIAGFADLPDDAALEASLPADVRCDAGGSIPRRMPPSEDPVTTHGESVRIITEMQGIDGGTTDRRQAHDPQAILSPAEVFSPHLRPRVEQRTDFLGFWVNRTRAISLVVVA
jgi:hypothetical protein